MPFWHKQHDPHAPMTKRAFLTHPATVTFFVLIVMAFIASM